MASMMPQLIRAHNPGFNTEGPEKTGGMISQLFSVFSVLSLVCAHNESTNEIAVGVAASAAKADLVMVPYGRAEARPYKANKFGFARNDFLSRFVGPGFSLADKAGQRAGFSR